MTEAGHLLTIYTLLVFDTSQSVHTYFSYIKHGQTTEEAFEACLRSAIDWYAKHDSNLASNRVITCD